MSGLKELLFGKHPKSVPEVPPQRVDAVVILPPIESAQGGEKERLEAECEEYLLDPKRVTVGDLFKFTQNMTWLIGGERHKSENGVVTYTSSNPLLDQETPQTSIVFRTNKLDMISIVHISAEFSDRQEGLQASFIPHGKLPDSYSMYADFHQKRPKFHSYITGEEEPEVPVSANREDLGPIAAKGFAQKVWGVYLQGQQAQSPTPQA